MDARTFQGHGLVNFSTANWFKFCKIKNPLRHTVKVSKLWRITRRRKNKAPVVGKSIGLSFYISKWKVGIQQLQTSLTRDTGYSKDWLNKMGNYPLLPRTYWHPCSIIHNSWSSSERSGQEFFCKVVVGSWQLIKVFFSGPEQKRSNSRKRRKRICKNYHPTAYGLT